MGFVMRFTMPAWVKPRYQFRWFPKFVSIASLTPMGRSWRWIYLLGVSVSFISALVYSYRDFNITLPGCLLREFIGVPCPSFGMTRSVLAVIRGRIWESIGYHLFGPVVLLGFVAFALHYAVELMLNRSISDCYSSPLIRSRYVVIGIALYLTYYGIRMVYWLTSGNLATALTG